MLRQFLINVNFSMTSASPLCGSVFILKAALLTHSQILFHCYLISFCCGSDVRTDGVKSGRGMYQLAKI